MPADGTKIKQDINNDLGNKGYRGVRTFMIIATLIKVVDWITGVVNGNLSTWLKTSDGQPGGSNTDSVYRIGKAIFGRNGTNGTAAAMEVTQAWIDNLNGNTVSPWFTITQPGDNLGGMQYYAICELPFQTGGTYDFAQIEFVGKGWDGTVASPIDLSVYMSNRGAFRYYYTSRWDGITNGTGLVAMLQADGRVIIYMFSNNEFKAISARVSNSIQVVQYQQAIFSATLTGTEVFHSGKPTVYRPMFAVRSRFTSITIGNSDGAWPAAPINEAGTAQLSYGANWIPGSSEVAHVNSNFAGSGHSFWQQTGATAKRFLAWITGGGDMIIGGTGSQPAEKLHVVGNIQADGYIRTGSGNSAFKITGVKTSSNLSLKTTRYLELTLSDGTVVKVAEVS